MSSNFLNLLQDFLQNDNNDNGIIPKGKIDFFGYWQVLILTNQEQASLLLPVIRRKMPRALRMEFQKCACLLSMILGRCKPARLSNHYSIQQCLEIAAFFVRIYSRIVFKLKIGTNMILNHRPWPQRITDRWSIAILRISIPILDSHRLQHYRDVSFALNHR